MVSSARRRQSRARLVLLGALVFAVAVVLAIVEACVDDAFEDGRFACDPRGDTSCPPGLVCAADGRCRSSAASVDSGGNDAGVEAAPNDAATIDACAIATWTVEPEGRAPVALAFASDGRLFAGGAAGDAGWLAQIDPCDGGVLREAFFGAPAPAPTVQDMMVTKDEIVVSGVTEDARTGVFARFREKDFGAIDTRAFDGGGGLVGFDTMTRAADGSYVLGGARDVFAPSMSGWLARVDGTAVCTASTGSAVTGVIPKGGADVLVFASQSDERSIEVRTIGPGCALGAPSTVAFPATLRGGPGFTTGSATSPVFVGAYGPKIDGGGFDWGLVGALDGGAMTLAAPVDPNPGRVDIVQRAVVVGDGLFAGVLQNASLTGGTPTLHRYALPLVEGAKPVYTTGMFGGTLVIIHAMIAPPDDADALFVAGPKPASRTRGAITRCRRSVGCGK